MMKQQHRYRLIQSIQSLLKCIGILVFSLIVVWPSIGQKKEADTLMIKSYNEESALLIVQKSYLQAEKPASEAFNKAGLINYPIGQARAALNLSKIYLHKNQYSEGLRYGIQAIDLFKSLNKPNALSDSYDQVAYLYEGMELYTKAIAYFELSLALKKQLKQEKQQLNLTEHLALCHEIIEEKTAAIDYYESLLRSYYKEDSLSTKVKSLLFRLSDLTEQQSNWQKAKQYNEQLLRLHSALNDKKGIIITLNNLGAIERKDKHFKEAESYFEQAEAIASESENELDYDAKVAILVNSSVVAANQNAYTRSRKLLNTALDYAIATRDLEQEANIYNHLAGNYYLSDIHSLAKDYVQQAMVIAKAQNANDVLEESYYLMYLLGLEKNDTEEAEKYQNLYEGLKSERRNSSNKLRQALLTEQVEADKQEANIRGLIASQEEQARRLRQVSLDAERRKKDLEIREKELALLKSEKELQKAAFINQKLEQERIKQRLILAEEEARNATQRQKIALLQKDKELQELAKKEQEKELALLNAKRKIDQETIKQQKQFNLGVTIILGLFGLLLLVLGLAYFLKRRANKKIKRQNEIIEQTNLVLLQQTDEITAQNTELVHKSDEIMAQRDQIQQQKEQIEESNHAIKQSIYAAESIQTAILPTAQEINTVFDDYFIIYRPKDIVSGDFYWLYQSDQYEFVVIADCTGHGVSGAFTCMIGHAQLNEIIGIRKMYDPAEILEELHYQINTMLKQEDHDIHTGMDLALIRLEHVNDDIEITYAGAKRDLYYALPNLEHIQSLKGSRRSIGGSTSRRKTPKPFVNSTVTLPKSSLIYAFSDGYTDQSDEDGRKIGTAHFVQFLENATLKPMDAQKKILENILDRHMGKAPQRDDILVTGFKLK